MLAWRPGSAVWRPYMAPNGLIVEAFTPHDRTAGLCGHIPSKRRSPLLARPESTEGHRWTA